jgi:NAD(P)-dependent dehydrogenase (short-subunit alcohol dehydrogenase family)
VLSQYSVPMERRVVVIGAFPTTDRGLGRALVAAALDAGYTVTAIARNAHGRPSLGDGVTVLEADGKQLAQRLATHGRPRQAS